MTMRIWFLLACLLFPLAQTLGNEQKEQDENGNRFHQLLTVLRSASPEEGANKVELADGVIGDTSFGKLTLSARACNEIALLLMASNDAYAQPNQSVLFGPDAWESLKIITGNPSVLDMLGYNKTIFGRLFLAKLLTAPTTDVDLITKRQYAIRSFAVSKQLKATVDTYLSGIARLQPHLLSLADANHPIYSDDIKLYHHDFIIRKIGRHNRTWENVTKLFADAWYLGNPIMLAALGKFIATIYNPKKTYRDIRDGYAPQTTYRQLKEANYHVQNPGFTLSDGVTQLADASTDAQLDAQVTDPRYAIKADPDYQIPVKLRGDDGIQALKDLPEDSAFLDRSLDDPRGFATSFQERLDRFGGMPKGVAHGIIGAMTAYLLYHSVNTVKWGLQRGGAIKYAYHQLKPLRYFFVALRKLRKIADHLPAFQALKDEIDFDIIDKNPDMVRLRKLLEGPAFKSSFMAQIMGGDIVMAIELMKKCRTHLFKGIALLGAFDAYSGLASWYEASQRGKLPPVCFASFVKSDTPRLAITDFWHPTIPALKMRTNSIKLGAPATNNAIITGLFESGKSKLLHSVALNVLCAQTFGLCPSRKYVGTPYAAINVYANIKDDLGNDRSLFKTELFRALQLLEFIKKLPKGSFSFSIADSTFTGTEAGAGRAAAYAVARYLGDLKNSNAIHATNFLSMALLGKQEPKKFTNYYLPSAFNGTVKHSYTLTPGVQEPHLATAIFKEEGLPEAMLEIINQQLGSAV